jgi:hypothetical protein
LAGIKTAIVSDLSPELIEALQEMSARDRLTIALAALQIDTQNCLDWSRHPNAEEWRTLTILQLQLVEALTGVGMNSVAHLEAFAQKLIQQCLAQLHASEQLDPPQ